MENAIDRWINRLDGKRGEPVTREQAIRAACDTIVVALGEKAAGYRLLVTGSAPFASVEELFPALNEALTSDGVHCVLCDNPVYHTDAYRNAGPLDGVVLLEQRKKSTYYELQKLRDFLAQAGVPVLGCIWLD